jgi:hypothetical protein
MLDWMRRNNKKLLAVFTVGLMIAFAFTPQWGRGQQDAAYTVGEINGRRVMQQDIAYPGYLWDFLTSSIFILSPNNPQPVPLAIMLTGEPQSGEQLAGQLRENHVMLYLLVDEARRMGITVSQSEIDEFARSVAVRVDDAKGARLVDLPNLANTEAGDRAQQALQQFILIQKSFMRAASVVKISQPILDQEQALSLQNVKLSAIEFPAADFKAQVPTPTKEQLEKQFNQFADQLPQIDPMRNPAGYGYRYSNRVKLQYVEVPAEEVRDVIRKSKSDYDWEVEAQKYYRKNQAEFPTTQPDKLAAKPFDLAPASQPSTQPTTKPFVDVKDEIVAKLIAPEASKLKDQIVNRILSTTGGDYMAYSATLKDSATTQRTSLNVAYDSLDYFSRLRDEIQKQYKVTIVVQQLANQFYTADDLRTQGTIGKSFLVTGNRNSPVIEFTDYVMFFCEKFQPEGAKRREGVLSMMAPSRPLSDGADNVFVFRLIEAQPSHRPASLEEVLDKVTADYLASAALNLANDAAKKALDGTRSQDLESVASGLGKPVAHTGWVSGQTGWRDPTLAMVDESRPIFAQHVVDMLADVKRNPASAVYKAIPLPRDAKVLLARLDNTMPAVPEDQLQFSKFLKASQYQGQMMSRLPADWFTWENIKQRNHFVDRMTLSKKDGK